MELKERYNLDVGVTLQTIYSELRTPPWLKRLPNVNLKLSEFIKEKSKYMNSTFLYTDGSKTEHGVGAAIGIRDQTFAWCLHPHSSIFSVEAYAVW